MKNIIKLPVIIALIAVIGLSMTACAKKPSETFDYSKILKGDLSEFAGTWEGSGTQIQLGTDGAHNFKKEDRGFYTWMIPGRQFDSEVRLFPVGVDIEYADLMLGGDIYPSDTTKVRLVLHHYSSQDSVASGPYYREASAVSGGEKKAAQAAETSGYSKILNGDLSDFPGYWENARGERERILPDGSVERFLDRYLPASGFIRTEDGVYVWGMGREEARGIDIILFPVGVQCDLGARVIETDTSKARMGINLIAGEEFGSPAGHWNIYYYESPHPLSSKILNGDLSDFMGDWVNAMGYTKQIRKDGTFTTGQTASGFSRTEDGFIYGIRADDGSGGFGVMLVPAGSAMSNGENVIETDTTKDRMAWGHDGPSSNAHVYYRGSFSYQLGDTGPGGGKIFHYDPNGFTMPDDGKVCHYLEAAPEDMPSTLAWASSRYTSTNIVNLANFTENNGYPTGGGRECTALILAADPDAPAAKACKEYRGGGKNDWFLPSLGDLLLLCWKRHIIGDILRGEWYWTSTQGDDGSAWFVDVREMITSQYTLEKNGNCYVRPIRAF
jgi:hypothetical protein